MTAVMSPRPSEPQPVGPPQTSRILQQVAQELRRGRHPLVTGIVGDLVLLLGCVSTLPEALVRLGSSRFEVVLRMNAADELDVVQGADVWRAVVRGAPGAVDDPIELIRLALVQREHPALVIVEQADILLQDPAAHDRPDRERVALLQLALREAATVDGHRNTCILLAGMPGSIPAVLLAGSEEIGHLDMAAPSRAEREVVLTAALDGMAGTDQLDGDGSRQIVRELASLTDGDTLRSIESLAAFSAAGDHSALDPRRLVHLHRFGDQIDHWEHLREGMAACRAHLQRRVFGQHQAVEAAMAAIAAAALGLDLSGNLLSSERGVRGLLWFIGPTGVGKTELAKAIAEAVFGDAEAYFRLDMSTFAQEHAAERLVGAPPGFVGYEQGGELTNAVRRRPNLVILLDEIDKAHRRVFDVIMSILDDGRITDAQGNVVRFGQAIVIATSNQGSHDLAALVAEHGDAVTYEQIAEASTAAVRRDLEAAGRPEIFGRIAGAIVPFDVLRPEIIDRIAVKFATDASFANGPRLDVDLPSTCAMARAELADPTQRALGGRQVRNVVQRHLRRLASWLGEQDALTADHVAVRFDGTTMLAAVDGGAFLPVA